MANRFYELLNYNPFLKIILILLFIKYLSILTTRPLNNLSLFFDHSSDSITNLQKKQSAQTNSIRWFNQRFFLSQNKKSLQLQRIRTQELRIKIQSSTSIISQIQQPIIPQILPQIKQYNRTSEHMNHLKKIAFILVLLTVAASQSTCRSVIDQLQTGTLTAYAPGFPDATREHTFTVQVNEYVVPASGFQITASFESASFSAFLNNGYDLSVRAFPGQNQNEAKIILLISNNNSWTSIVISYLISSRSDIFAGLFFADAFSLTTGALQNKTFAYMIPGWKTYPSSISSAVQIAGLRTSSNSVQSIQIKSSFLKANTGLLSVDLSIDANTLVQYFVFSYIWWVNSPNLIVATYDPLSGKAIDHQFSGVTQIFNNRFVYHAMSFSGPILPQSIQCIGSVCPASCVSISQCVSTNGIIANSICFLCGPAEQYQNFRCEKIVCPQNMVLIGQKCTCPTNYFLTMPNICSQCPLNAHWNSTTCICNDGYFMNQKQCLACPKFSLFDSISRICQCISGYIWFDNSCISCLKNQKWDSVSQSCTCIDGFERVNNQCLEKCPENSKRNNLVCVCNAGLRNASGKCLPCPPNSVYVPSLNNCVCGLGFYFFNNSCITCSNSQNQMWNPNLNECQCMYSYYRIDGKCSQCTNNSTWNGSECVCDPGYIKANSTACTTCGDYKAWNGTACACKETFANYNDICYCPLGSRLVGDKCLCGNGMAPVNLNCGNILTVSIPNTCGAKEELVNNTCLCISNYVKVNEVCTACPDKSASNGTDCICIRGLFMVDGKCVECDKNSVYNQKKKTCLCKQGFYGNYSQCSRCHKDCKTCDGGASNNCLSCDKGDTLFNNSCVNKKNDKQQNRNSENKDRSKGRRL